jgi:hypothetical protein
LAFRTEFCETPEQSSLRPLKPGLSRENWDKGGSCSSATHVQNSCTGPPHPQIFIQSVSCFFTVDEKGRILKLATFLYPVLSITSCCSHLRHGVLAKGDLFFSSGVYLRQFYSVSKKRDIPKVCQINCYEFLTVFGYLQRCSCGQ